MVIDFFFSFFLSSFFLFLFLVYLLFKNIVSCYFDFLIFFLLFPNLHLFLIIPPYTYTLKTSYFHLNHIFYASNYHSNIFNVLRFNLNLLCFKSKIDV